MASMFEYSNITKNIQRNVLRTPPFPPPHFHVDHYMHAKESHLQNPKSRRDNEQLCFLVWEMLLRAPVYFWMEFAYEYETIILFSSILSGKP